MDPAIAGRLIDLNRTFYDEFATEFSQSRTRLNIGIPRSLEGLTPSSILDLGCGDGRVGFAWISGELGLPVPEDARYVGFDHSRELLGARGEWPPPMNPACGDLLESWENVGAGAGFDLVVCFAALHHVPGRARRVELLRRIRDSLTPGGQWVLSVWQFLHLERFRSRIVPWDAIGLETSDVESGDVLLDWRRGGRGLRYVHHFEPSGLETEISEAGLTLDRSFRSDGETGDLGLYCRGRGPDPK